MGLEQYIDSVIGVEKAFLYELFIGTLLSME